MPLQGALAGTPSNGNLISKNSFSGNGGNAIDLVGAGGDNNVGDGVSVNDSAIDANAGNFGLDYPVIISARSPEQTPQSRARREWCGPGYIGGGLQVDRRQRRWHRARLRRGSAVPGHRNRFRRHLVDHSHGLELGDLVSAIGITAAKNTSEFGANYAVTLNTAPVAVNDTYSTNEDTSLSVTGGQWDVAMLNWQYRSTLTVNSIAAGTQTDFPVLVTISAAQAAQMQAAGQDLRFVDADGTLLAYEIESWNPGGTSYAWVKVPQLDTVSGADFIRMYWGNAGAVDAQNAAGVWSNGYNGVWHLNNNVQDSTGTNTAVNNGTTALAGEIAQGQDFNGTGNYVQTSSTTLKTADTFTIGTWFNADATDYTRMLLWEGMSSANGFGDPTAWGTKQERHIAMGSVTAAGVTSSDYLSFFLGDTDAPTDAGVIQISTRFTDIAGWHYVSVVVSNMSAAPTATMYLDGVAVGTDTGTLAHTSRTGWTRRCGLVCLAQRPAITTARSIKSKSRRRHALRTGSRLNTHPRTAPYSPPA